MPDDTDTLVPTPLLTSQGVLVCEQFSDGLATLCNIASQSGMTPNMIAGQLSTMSMMISFQVKDAVDAALAAAAPVPAPAPPAPAAPGPLTLVNGVSTAPIVGGVVLTLGAVVLPVAAGPALTLALDPSPAPLTGPGAYSLELAYGTSTGLTYTANGIWPGLTLYGKEGDMLKLEISSMYGDVLASISQDGGMTWQPFYTYNAAPTVPQFVHITQTPNVLIANVTGS